MTRSVGDGGAKSACQDALGASADLETAESVVALLRAALGYSAKAVHEKRADGKRASAK